MKTIVLLVAVLAMVGFAAAWDTQDTLQYQYVHAMYMQAGSPVDNSMFNNVQSTASFSTPNPYETASSNNGLATGTITNTLVTAHTTTVPTESDTSLLQPSQTITLTQGGEVDLATHALDSQDDTPEVEASLSKFQNLHFSGVYTDTSAQFSDSGNVGINCDTTTNPNAIKLYEQAANTVIGSGSCATTLVGDVSAVGTGSKFTESDVGVASTSGLTWDMVTDTKTLSGSSTAYSAFTGGYTNGGSSNYIQTTSGDFTTKTWWQ